MRVFCRRHLDVGVLINNAGSDVVAVKAIGHRTFLALGPADLGIRLEDIERAADKRLDPATINVGRLGWLIFPLRDHQGGQPRRYDRCADR